MFKAPFSFNGRIRRLEFGISLLLYIFAIVAISTVMEIEGDSTKVFGILILPLIWFMYAQNAKRCHDRGNSGWYQLIPFYIFVLIFADGEIGENDYGINPKGIGNNDEVEEIGNNAEY